VKLVTVHILFIIIETTKISSSALNVKIFTASLQVALPLQKYKCYYSTCSFVWEILMTENTAWYRSTQKSHALAELLTQKVTKISHHDELRTQGDSKEPVHIFFTAN
jgi:hypothetical protein